MSTPHTVHRRAIAVALGVTVLWSSSWILIRTGMDDEALAPITFAGLRYGLAALVLLALIASRMGRRAEVRRLDPRMWGRLATLGTVFVAMTQGAQFVAIDNQPAATTSLTLAPTALLVAVASARLIGERSGTRQIVGATLIAVGAGIYFAGDLGATAVGMTAAVVGLLANVSGALLGRATNRAATISPLVVTGLSMAVGASLLLVAGLAVEGRPTLTGRVVMLIGWLAMVNTALAFTAWNWSLRHLTAVESSAINNTMLIQIALLAWVFLGEAPGVLGSAGIVVVTVGAVLASAGRSPTARTE